jgi:hypothetical protein
MTQRPPRTVDWHGYRYAIAQKRVIALQRYARGWMARRWFRPALREYRYVCSRRMVLLSHSFPQTKAEKSSWRRRRQINAVARMQALWRGKRTRHEARIRCVVAQRPLCATMRPR